MENYQGPAECVHVGEVVFILASLQLLTTEPPATSRRCHQEAVAAPRPLRDVGDGPGSCHVALDRLRVNQGSGA